MASYLKRSFVCDRLRLSRWQSYQIVGSSRGPRINSNDVLYILNRARRGIPEPYSWPWFPWDFLTPDELANELKDSDITAHDLLCWTRRKKAVPPHFRLNKCTIRFSRSQFMKWLDERSRIKTLRTRIA
jgi:hypothetical protein